MCACDRTPELEPETPLVVPLPPLAADASDAWLEEIRAGETEPLPMDDEPPSDAPAPRSPLFRAAAGLAPVQFGAQRGADGRYVARAFARRGAELARLVAEALEKPEDKPR